MRTTDSRILGHLHQIQNHVFAIHSLLDFSISDTNRAAPEPQRRIDPDKAAQVMKWLEANPYRTKIVARQVRTDIREQTGIIASYQLIRAIMTQLGYQRVREEAGIFYHPARITEPS